MRLPRILGDCTPAADKIIIAKLKEVLPTLTPRPREVALMMWRQEEKKGKTWDEWGKFLDTHGRIAPCIAQIRMGFIFSTDSGLHVEKMEEVEIAGVFGMFDEGSRFPKTLGDAGSYDFELFGTQADVRTYLKHRAVALQEEILRDISEIHGKAQDIFNTHKLLKELSTSV